MNAQSQSYHIQAASISKDGLSKPQVMMTALFFLIFEGCTWSRGRALFLNELSQGPLKVFALSDAFSLPKHPPPQLLSSLGQLLSVI